jgi:catechol 2,3-dioxygenase-like lactoylglutathione lyase family enzyme
MQWSIPKMRDSAMSTLRIEHVNVTVRDPAATAKLFEAIFGWHIRWQGPARDGGHSVHVGSNDTYLALYTDPAADYSDADFAKGRPLNHIGVEVDDLDAVEACVMSVGLTPFNHDDYAPGRRFYFFDSDGIEYEVISYR